MKNFKKGFTLIELLAVIVILSVVALVSTPIVLNVVDDAKDSARESKLKLYADNVKLKATETYFTNGGNIDGEYTTSELNDSSTTCDKAYYLGGKTYLANCTVDGNSGYYYVDGSVNETKPDNFDNLVSIGLPNNDSIAYLNNPTEPSYPVNATPCEKNGLEFTHILDKRDNNTYAVTQIGEQCWFADNLAYTTPECLNAEYSSIRGCHINGGSNWDKDEVLYQWGAVMNWNIGEIPPVEGAQGICPYGWYVPTKSDFQKLLDYSGSNSYINLLHSVWGGTDQFGFGLLPVGYRSWDFSQSDIGNVIILESSTYNPYYFGEYYPDQPVPFGLTLYIDSEDVFLYEWEGSFSHSVRCLLAQ